jgi:drug/metabolite transporter (DMT)-like permease
MLLGAIVLKQGLTALQFLGMVVVLVCLTLSQRHLFLRERHTDS